LKKIELRQLTPIYKSGKEKGSGRRGKNKKKTRIHKGKDGRREKATHSRWETQKTPIKMGDLKHK